MIDIRRGATPTFEFETDFDLSEFSDLYITIKQGTGRFAVFIEKTLKKDCLVTDERHFSCRLSQEDSLSLDSSKKAELQLKGKTAFGDVIVGDIVAFDVKRVLMEGAV